MGTFRFKIFALILFAHICAVLSFKPQFTTAATPAEWGPSPSTNGVTNKDRAHMNVAMDVGWSLSNGLPQLLTGRAVVFGGKLLHHGGLSPIGLGTTINTTYATDDGLNWAELPMKSVFLDLPNNEQYFVGRGKHTLTIFADKLYVVGGQYYEQLIFGAVYSNLFDVWVTDSDLRVWTELYDSADATRFPDRYGHGAFVLKDKLWVAGGSTGIANTLGYRADVWSSSNCVNWTQAIDTNFPGRASSVFVVFQSYAWFVGGTYNGIQFGDVWRTADGVQWVNITQTAGFTPARTSHGMVVFGPRMYLVGGVFNVSFLSDSWSSADGARWRAEPILPEGHAQMYVVAFKDQLLALGGRCTGMPPPYFFCNETVAAWHVSSGNAPVNCTGSFVDNGACSKSCGGGKQKQVFHITMKAANGGAKCKYANGKTIKISCNMQKCAVNCTGSWKNATKCSKPCGLGTLRQTFKVTVKASNGGVDCPAKNGATRKVNCTLIACPKCKAAFATNPSFCPTGYTKVSNTGKTCKKPDCTQAECCIKAP